ncbi:MAG TPA: sialidase family protein [Ramlibacter sp.]|nr:sialidase family protein [Ramlibacter sp.]
MTPPAPAPAPAPGPAPAPAPATEVTVTTLAQQTEPNKTYNVAATVPGTVVLTLPSALTAGDTVTINGQSANDWLVAQNAGQSVVTTNLAGNVAPGALWTASSLVPKVWHWISSDATGQVLLAGEAAGGFLNTSTDGGATWTTGDSTGAIWISSDMTPTASRMVAVAFAGGMYSSTDRGVTWTQMTSTSLGVDLNAQSFESVTISNDGQRIAAVIQGGGVIFTTDGGTTWAIGAGAPTASGWRSIDSSADGSVLVAVTQDNTDIYLSTNSGATWTASPVAVGSPAAPVFDTWYRSKISADGNTIVVAGNQFGGSSGSGVYVSRDRGVTWTQGLAAVGDYSAIAMSTDGQTIGVTQSNANVGGAAGRVLLSTDAGATFTPTTITGAADTDWRAIAMSADGNKLAVAAGRFLGPVTGQLYTSLGNRTSSGVLGSITGLQNSSVQLQYLGDGRFSIIQSSGGPFSIR